MIFDDLSQFKQATQTTGRLLGLDLGDKKIGIAIADETRTIATPFDIYQRRSISKDLGHLNNLINTEALCATVIGLPLELDGTEGSGCQKVRHFADKLFKKSSLPIFLADERLSTSAVTTAMKDAGMTRKKRQAIDDKLAASYILQGVIDRL